MSLVLWGVTLLFLTTGHWTPRQALPRGAPPRLEGTHEDRARPGDDGRAAQRELVRDDTVSAVDTLRRLNSLEVRVTSVESELPLRTVLEVAEDAGSADLVECAVDAAGNTLEVSFRRIPLPESASGRQVLGLERRWSGDDGAVTWREEAGWRVEGQSLLVPVVLKKTEPGGHVTISRMGKLGGNLRVSLSTPFRKYGDVSRTPKRPGCKARGGSNPAGL